MGQILRAGLSVSSIKAEGSAAPGNSFLFGRFRTKSESPELRTLAKEGKQKNKKKRYESLLYDPARNRTRTVCFAFFNAQELEANGHRVLLGLISVHLAFQYIDGKW
jgi:hypothetical protein